MLDRYKIGITISAHKGNLNLFHSYVFGEDINITARLSELGRDYRSDQNRIFAALSGKIVDEVRIIGSDAIFQELDGNEVTQKIYKSVIHKYRVYRLMAE